VYVCACVCVFRTSLLTGAIKCSTLLLSISSPRLISLWSPGSYYWRMLFKKIGLFLFPNVVWKENPLWEDLAPGRQWVQCQRDSSISLCPAPHFSWWHLHMKEEGLSSSFSPQILLIAWLTNKTNKQISLL
jgi:hypothetical protein